jgi:hypothetical protein
MAKQVATNDSQSLTLYQKLLKIQQEVIGLGKDSKSFGYQYVSGSKVLEYVKPLMNQYGILLKQEVIDIENTRQDYHLKDGKVKSEILSKVMMKFTWIDSESGEKDENFFGANGQNDWEKGLGSALTYAERYFLLKYFHINTDEDDIDNPSRTKSGGSKMPITKDRFDKALLAIKAGTYSKEAMLGAFALSPEQLEQLG